jgi:pimeloyl-ACP methyl ester carboxylesterase
MTPINYLQINNTTLAYRKTPGKNPGVIFCSGFMSDMNGSKALALEQFCREQKRAYVRFDYRGRGQSLTANVVGTIGEWRDDALAILDTLTEGEQILVGSSMGGWIMLLLALARPERIAGLIGIAAGTDFTEELIWNKFSSAQRATLLRDGIIREAHAHGAEPYVITCELIEDGRRHLLLPQKIICDKPVRLLHGLMDTEVPWQNSIRLAEQLSAQDVRIHFIKDGDHRLSRPADLLLLQQTLLELF